MTKDQMRVKVAVALGAKWYTAYNRCYLSFKDLRENGIHWYLLGDQPNDGQDLHIVDDVPRYPEDLNVCAEMEKALKGRQIKAYWQVYLPSVCKADRDEFLDIEKVASATAYQRCEAFLKVKGLL